MSEDEGLEEEPKQEEAEKKQPLIQIKGNTLFKIGGKTSDSTLKLFDKFEKFLGVYTDPQRKVEKAKAKAEADLIKEEGKIRVKELRERSLNRRDHEEMKYQENIENILLKASTHLKDDSNPEKIDEDWSLNYISKVKLISDEGMQDLWAKLLAGESNEPGSFSKKTVNLVNDLGKEEADLFTRLCSFMVYCPIINPIDYIPVIYDLTHNLYKENGITFDTLFHLDFMGLINFDHLSTLHLTYSGQQIPLVYFKRFNLLQLKSDNKFIFGKVKLTKSGKELASIAGGVEANGFYDYLLKKWIALGYISPQPKQ